MRGRLATHIYTRIKQIMPLVTPESYNSFKLLSIDPGTRHLGLAYYTVDSRDYRILSLYTETVKVWKETLPPGIEEELYTDRFFKLLRISTKIRTTMDLFKPSIVACEGPFFNGAFPDAYGALCSVVTIITEQVHHHNPAVEFHTYQPQEVKKVVGAKLIRNNTEEAKRAVRVAVSENTEIMAGLKDNLDDLSEHAVDAIAIGFCCLKGLFRNDH